MKIEIDITKMVEENEEEFIFETIRPYCENVLQIKINKEKLKQILLNNMKKQQTCDDCISRTETLNKMNELVAKYIPIMPVGWTLPLNISKTIVDMPPVEPKGVTITDFADRCRECGKIKSSWIPVSERLPDKEGKYLVTIFRAGYKYVVTSNLVCHNFDFIWEDNDVVAWMPLPEAYEENEEVNE